MKRLMFILNCMFLIPFMLSAAKIQRAVFNYFIEDFNIEYIDSLLFVSSPIIGSYNPPFLPDLPSIGCPISLPKGMKCIGYRVEAPDTIKICEGRDIAVTPGPVFTNGKVTGFTKIEKWVPQEACDAVFPIEKVSYIPLQKGVIIYPMEYDADKKELFLTPTVIVDFILADEEMDSNDVQPSIDSEEDEIIDVIIFKGTDEIKVQSLKLDENFDIQDDPSIDDPIDYLIITYDWFEDYFKPLLDWKTQKGLRCKLKTLEEIEVEYEKAGETVPERIKAYIYDMYKNHGVSYVLIGGNLPIPKVKVEKSQLLQEDGIVPTDLYYACFDGQFDWDANKNGILGETDDNISLIPNIIVTRLPVSIPTHLSYAIKKIIDYEKSGKIKKSIFMEGALLSDSVDVFRDGKMEKITDGQAFSESIYNSYIKPHWDGKLTTLYSGRFMGDAVRAALFNGHGFIDIQSHGEPDRWIFKDGDYYSSDYALHNINPNYSIITTNACFVNAFDVHESYSSPCLSQTLISEPTNGVVAFLGSSREGWGYNYGTQSVGPSQIHIGAFYNSLFANQDAPKNFGKLVALGKKKLANQTDRNALMRWLQLSINPIGDPEMPIYTNIGRPFHQAKVSMEDGEIIVDTGVEDCVICLTGELNGKLYQKVFRNGRNVVFTEIPENGVVCITKQNYKPYIQKLAEIIEQSLENESTGRIVAVRGTSTVIEAELDIPESSSEVALTLTDIMSNTTVQIHPSPEEKIVEIETGRLVNGFYILTLYVDGYVNDAKRLVIE